MTTSLPPPAETVAVAANGAVTVKVFVVIAVISNPSGLFKISVVKVGLPSPSTPPVPVAPVSLT